MSWSEENIEKCSKVGKCDGNDEDIVSEEREPLHMNLAKRSYECFIKGVSIFEEINDNSNLSILLCNLGRFMRFRAHLQDDKEFCFKKMCYLNALNSYKRALTILESKKHSSKLWEIVTFELSSCQFTLAKLMQQHFHNEMV